MRNVWITVVGLLLCAAYAQTDVLFDAARVGGVAEVRAAFAGGANLEARNDEGLTPLLVAVRDNDPDVVRVLLNNLSDPNEAAFLNTRTDETIFALAVDNPNRDRIYRLLLERGVSVRLGDGPRTGATQLAGPPLPSF
ncbi:MAG: ankyrin repeat domain-containing protein [Trueperaceae bacterium]|nr:ankyrin repeat domain-containing protein [Trueperaceae bacterium]